MKLSTLPRLRRLRSGTAAVVRLRRGKVRALIATAPVVDVEPQAPPPSERTPLDDTDLTPPENGVPWRMPIFFMEGWETSDGRYFEPGGWGRRDLPQTLMAMVRNPDGGWGHDAALISGRIDTMNRYDASAVINRETGQPFGPNVWAWEATGYFIPHPDQPGSQAALDYVRQKALRGVSVDLGEVEAEIDVLEEDEDGFPEKVRFRAISGVIGQATVCPFAAFPGAYIELTEEEPLADSELPPVDAARALTITASAAPEAPQGLAPLLPPRSWFANQNQPDPSRHVYLGRQPDGTPTGQVWGYIAEWGVPHSAIMDREVLAPRIGLRGYQTFMSRGTVCTAEGEELSVGLLSYGGGHDMNMNHGVVPALAHYDNTSTAYAKVVCGEDDFGPWFAGTMMPHLTRAQIEDFGAHPVSGDWRADPGDRDVRLVAALSVNTPGFEIGARRFLAASGARALVAAGSAPLTRRARAAAGGTDASAVEAAINRALRPVLASAAREQLRRLTRPRN